MKVWWLPRYEDTGRHMLMCGALLVVLALIGLALVLMALVMIRGMLTVAGW